MFCLTEMNNAILTSTKAMPLKDLTSDNYSTFSMARKQYIRVLGEDTNFNVNTNIQKNGMAILLSEIVLKLSVKKYAILLVMVL